MLFDSLTLLAKECQFSFIENMFISSCSYKETVFRDLPGGKRILIIKMRDQHITFSKAIKAITVRF